MNDSAIRDSLQIGQPTCPITKGCILEGELAVYSGKEHRILNFYKIRKHIFRSGTFIGTAQDSQAHSWEHLMIVYYDVRMLDDTSLLSVRIQRAKSDLRRAFAECITAKGEGLVLKSDDPYFNFDSMRRPYRCCAIKLKKEYISNFGDIGAFAIVGARYDAAKARTYNIPHLKWAHFYGYDSAADEGIDRDRDRDVLSEDAHDENTLQNRTRSIEASCGLSSFSVLLSPCIANFPYVGDLLRCHGIHEPVIDANSWKETRFASTKRLALVEPQRREATQAFFDVITSLELRKRGLDEHEYIPIFDWRVLERMKTEEAKKEMEARGER
ncbi:hypothetical protein QC762_0041310 [Podospora pseudocomata]|uniref:ATP-dependent DNA ligase family profile domain-containing protein n=1 Tax=Podospora pseudocomata TaxID=2093779 RepID=A0ABR0GMV8_9PEZI|nr:hypothetical protein QC762_0041310 [Podospora pseudocomata]